eukprot:730757-Prymnesium_polylepis.1
MNSSGYAATVEYYFRPLPGHVYAIELLAWMAGRDTCLWIDADDVQDTATNFLMSIEDRGPEYKAASALVASFGRKEVATLARINGLEGSDEQDQMCYELALRSLIAQTGIKPRNWNGFATRTRVFIFTFLVKLAVLAIRARQRANAPGGAVEARLKEGFDYLAKRQRSLCVQRCDHFD